MAYTQQKFIFHSSGGWKFKIRVPAGFISGEALFWVADCLILAVSSHGGRGEGDLWGLFYKGADPIMRTPPS